MARFLTGLILGILILAAIASGSLDTSQYETERTRIAEANQTERTYITEANQTERTYISAQSLMWLATERESTLRLTVMLMAVSVVVTAILIALVVALHVYTNHRQPPAHIVMLALQTNTVPEFDRRHGWLLVDSADRAYTVHAAQRDLLPRDTLQA